MFRQNLLAFCHGFVEDAFDLVVDESRRFFGIAFDMGEITPDKYGVAAVVEGDGAETVAHAVFRHHGTGDGACGLDVAGCAGGDVIQHDLFGHAAAQRRNDALEHLASGVKALILLGAVDRHAAGLAAGDDGNMVHGIHVGEMLGYDGMAGLMVCRELPVLFRHDARLLFGTGYDLQRRRLNLLHRYKALVVAGGQERGFVEKILQVGAGKTRRPLGDAAQVDVVAQDLAFGMDPEDRLAPFDVGQPHVDRSVEAARAQKRVVQNIRAVRSRHDDDALVSRKAVHFHEQLVESLFALVVAAAEPGAAVTADGVDFVDKNNRGSKLFRLVKEVADAGSADAHIELHEVGAGNRKELDARLSGNRLA